MVLMHPRILAIIPTLLDDPKETIKSLNSQTVKVSKIIVVVGSRKLYKKLAASNGSVAEYFYLEPNFQYPLGKRVAVALNYALSNVRLKSYDYILRVDADVILPSRFIEENLKANVDCVGKAGYAMLLKMDSFIAFFNGRFVEVGAEDSYIGLKLLSLGRSVIPWLLPPKLKRKSDSYHSWRYYFVRGIEMYKLGYEPIHVIEVLRHDIRNIFTIIGYLTSIIRRLQRYDIANWVFKAQLKRIFYGKKF
jgi:glycosyltransferase involved in cell wall biosynthesis